MINITDIETQYEENSLWLNIKIYSSENTEEYSHITIYLTGKETEITTAEERLKKGNNSLELLFPIETYPWFPIGTGETNTYEIVAEVTYKNEKSSKTAFFHTGEITFENDEVCINSFYPEIFGLSVKVATPEIIDTAAKWGINTVFTDDSRADITEYCTIKGLVILPYRQAWATLDDIASLRKHKKNIILPFSELNHTDRLKKLLKPIFVGKDFISNNTNDYVCGTLKTGTLNPQNGRITVLKEEKISIPEFSVFDYEPVPDPKQDEISYACLCCNKNIISKYINTNNLTHFPKGKIFVSRLQINENIWAVVFSSNEFIHNLEIITEDDISENYFDIFPGESVQVIFRPKDNTPQFEIRNQQSETTH